MSRSAGGSNKRRGSAGAGTSVPVSQGKSKDLSDYWSDAERPLSSLVFVLPLLIAYELGMRFVEATSHSGGAQHIIAFNLLGRFFALFGASGAFLPPLAVVSILLAWHVARRDAWGVRVETLCGMVLESCVLALPVLGIGYALSHAFPLAAGSATNYIVLSIGAGVYEELVFRLILFTLLAMLLRDAFGVSRGWAALLMVVGSGLLFSVYHYLSPAEDFRLQTFVFRTLAGVYFGVVFMVRGFGITAASHAIYDIVVVYLAMAQG